MSQALTTVEILPTARHQYTIIWLHGLGADGHDFESIVPELRLPQQAETHFIFPNAPVQPVTVNGGMSMPAWYDILERSLERKVDIKGIYQSASQITQLIDQAIAKDIAAHNILLAGFSQGGVIALHTGLRYPQRLAGIVALSTYLPTSSRLPAEASAANRSLPILMAHGTQDTVVAIESAQAAYNDLIAQGYLVQWQEYPMQHSVCVPEIRAIASFINTAFSA